MAQFPSLPLFTDAYLADTRHLTTQQHGAYLLLLMMAWRTPDCAIPDDNATLARWAAMDVRTWRNNRDVVLAFWRPFTGEHGKQKWRQARLLDERKHAEHVHSKNVAAGRASALKRQERGSTNVATDGQRKSNPQTQTHIEEDKSSSIAPSKTEKLTKAPARAKPQSTFEQHFGATPTCPAEYANDASRNHGFSQERIDAAFAGFCDFHASKGSRFTDWRAAFRTWCRNEVSFAARGSVTAGRGVRDNAAAAVSAVVARRYGTAQPGGGVGGWQAAGQAGADGGGDDGPLF